MQLLNYEVFFSGRVQQVGGRFGCFAAAITLLVTVCNLASAATINVGPGQTIASGIAAASTGDTVLVAAGTRNESIVITKSVTVKANGLVTLRPGGSRGVDVQCSNCTVDGFRFENFGQAASGGNSNRSNVTLKNLNFQNAGNGIWVWGTGWRVENVTMYFRPRGGEDYMNAFGSGHTFRRLFFYGCQPEDLLEPDGSYKHNDCIQTWTAGGAPGLKNTLIEECIFTDFAQGTYIHNEDGVSGAVSNITVRNNVFWGVDFPRAGGTLPSHGTRLTGPGGGVMVVKNNLYKYISNIFRLGALTDVTIEGNIVMNGGSVYSLTSMTSSNVKRGTLGNLLWSNNNSGDMSGSPDKTNINPQVRNASAEGLAVIGPDGIPWTSDDAWRTQNTLAAAYGPQITPNEDSMQILAELRDLFSVLDGNDDGFLTIVESALSFEVFAFADFNNDGRLSIVELLEATVGPVGVRTVVYVDFNYTGWEDGTDARPFNSLYEAANFVASGGSVAFAAPTIGESVQINGPMTLMRDNS